MLPVFVDENVKAGVVDGLKRRGVDVVFAQESGHRETSDESLLAIATAESRLLLTNDTDFLRIHAEWQATGRSHAGIVYWRQELSIGKAIRGIHQYILQTRPEQARDAVQFL